MRPSCGALEVRLHMMLQCRLQGRPQTRRLRQVGRLWLPGRAHSVHVEAHRVRWLRGDARGLRSRAFSPKEIDSLKVCQALERFSTVLGPLAGFLLVQCMYVDQINKIYVASRWAACGGETRHGWDESPVSQERLRGLLQVCLV